ncbi:MAG: hypothetical protein ACE5IP_03720 [Terriglobia bacterium]
MSDPFEQMAEFAGKASGIIVRDLADISKPLTEAFRRGWRRAMTDEPKTDGAPSAPDSASESA